MIMSIRLPLRGSSNSDASNNSFVRLRKNGSISAGTRYEDLEVIISDQKEDWQSPEEFFAVAGAKGSYRQHIIGMFVI